MLAVPEEARDEVVPQNVRHLLVQCAYFDEQQLRHCLFPLAPTPSKALVRAEAAQRADRLTA